MSEKQSMQNEDLIGKIPLFAGLPRVEASTSCRASPVWTNKPCRELRTAPVEE